MIYSLFYFCASKTRYDSVHVTFDSVQGRPINVYEAETHSDYSYNLLSFPVSFLCTKKSNTERGTLKSHRTEVSTMFEVQRNIIFQRGVFINKRTFRDSTKSTPYGISMVCRRKTSFVNWPNPITKRHILIISVNVKSEDTLYPESWKFMATPLHWFKSKWESVIRPDLWRFPIKTDVKYYK